MWLPWKTKPALLLLSLGSTERAWLLWLPRLPWLLRLSGRLLRHPRLMRLLGLSRRLLWLLRLAKAWLLGLRRRTESWLLGLLRLTEAALGRVLLERRSRGNAEGVFGIVGHGVSWEWATFENVTEAVGAEAMKRTG